MQISQNRISHNGPLNIFLALIIFLLAQVLACSNEPENVERRKAQKRPESFTFFELGNNSVLNEKIREKLQQQLGNDAIEQRSIINLESNYQGFLQKYFPGLNDLNQRLNYPPGERVDHNTVKLMFRYAQKKNIPFDYVELVFSNYTKSPILIRIDFRRDESNIIQTLEEKYGRPDAIDWQQENGQTRYWVKNRDVLMLNIIPDQFGNPRYRIMIYFHDNIEDLLAAEKKEREQKEQERNRSGRRAF